MKRLRPGLIALLAVLLIPAGLARASAYTKVLATYQHTGTVPACTFSSAELQSALKGVDTYGAQYFADFTNAIQSALSARASGQCLPARHNLPLGIGNGPAGAPAVPGSLTAASGSDVPAPLLLLGIFAALLALGGAIVAVARVRGWDPGWVVAWRHAWAETGYRLGGSWAEFRDWLRSA